MLKNRRKGALKPLTPACFFSIITDCKVFVLYTLLRGKEVVTVAKNLEIIMLLDFYGEMLTEKQRDFLGYYYNDDLSLSEIAENEGITRQGVRDSIKRAESQLLEMEEKLSFAKRFEEVRRGLNQIIQYADEISECNMRCGLSREINDTTVKIKAMAQTLCE